MSDIHESNSLLGGFANSDEFINSDLKRGAGSKVSPRSEKELEYLVHSHLKKLQLSPSKISAFFSARFTSYAA